MRRYQGQYSARKKKRRSVVLPILLCVCLLASIAAGGVTLARYVLEKQGSAEAKATNFYFTSDFLRKDGAQYTVYTNSVTFSLSNSDGVSKTQKPIQYAVSAQKADGTAVELTLKDSNEDTGGVLNIDRDTDTFSFSGSEGDVITVTANSSSPYTQRLSATFTFANPGTGSHYTLTDHGMYCELELYIGASAPDSLTINHGGLVPDSTSGLTAGWTDGASSHSVTGLVANAHYTLIFFDSSGNNYTQNGSIENDAISIDASQ